jgi:hypothetical protein
LTAPAVSAGATALISVEPTNVTELDAVPPNFTVAPPTIPVPVIVTVLPPAVEPVSGETLGPVDK